MNKIYLGIFAYMFVYLAVASAVSCTPQNLQVNLTEGSGDIKSVFCFNSNTTSSVNIVPSGSYFSIDTFTIPANTGKTITITFSQSAQEGYYFNTLNFDDGSNSFPILLKVNSAFDDIIVFPTSKVVTIDQGTTKQQSIQVTVPSNYPRPVTIQSVSFNPDIDVVSFGDLDLGVLNPGDSLQIPLKIDAVGAQTGTYSTDISFLATDSQGRVNLPSSHLDVNVQTVTNPTSNNTFAQRPSCSLSATQLNLNSTYSFTCSNVVQNIQINVPYNEYYQGISVDTVPNVYTYTFRPVKFGNTKFFASFSYQGSTIFEPFSQDIRISSSSSSIDGTSLRLLFTPSLENLRSNEQAIIQLVDNRTGNLVASPELYVDAIQLMPNGTTFYYSLQLDRSYMFRARSSGYDDLVINISLPNRPINISIIPDKGSSATFFTISTDVNASLFLDGSKIDSFFKGTIPAGNHTITAIKEGFLETQVNLTVDQSLLVTLSTEFKKGKEQRGTLPENVSWAVYYSEDFSSQQEMIANGTSDEVIFTPEEVGIYTIKSGDEVLNTYKIEGFSLNFTENWLWYTGGIVIIIGLLFFFRKKQVTHEQGLFSGNINGG